MRDPQERLLDILEALERIERYAVRGRSAFEQDELVQSWIVRHLQIVGEAARALPPAVRDLAPAAPWASIIGMRHILTHDYFRIDADIIWDTVMRDLPIFKSQVEALLRLLQSSSEG